MDWYAEYYTNREYGLLFWHRNEMNDLTYKICLSEVKNKAFYHFAYSNRLEPRLADLNRRARMRGGLPNPISQTFV